MTASDRLEAEGAPRLSGAVMRGGGRSGGTFLAALRGFATSKPLGAVSGIALVILLVGAIAAPLVGTTDPKIIGTGPTYFQSA